jgi:hypothetical protein
MVKCPQCKSNLSFFKIAFLTPNNTNISCGNCNAYLVANRTLVINTGKLCGGIATFLLVFAFGGRRNRHRDFTEFSIYPLVGMFFIPILYSIILYFSVEFAIGERPIKKEFRYSKAPSKFNRIEYLKYKHHRKSIDELNKMLTHPGWTEDARQAAKELIEEKNKNVT